MSLLPAKLVARVVAVLVIACLGASGYGEETPGGPMGVVPEESLAVANVDPPTPIAGRENWLVVYGRGFGEDETKVEVHVGDMKAEEVRVQSSRRLRAKVPAGIEAGVASVTVKNPGGETATLENAVYFRRADEGFSLQAMAFRMRYDWRGFVDWFRLGGPLMYPLAVISFFGVAWMVHCFLVLRRSQVLPPRFMATLSSHLAQGDTRGAMAACERTPCVLSKVMVAGFRKLGEAPEKIREAIAVAGSRESAHLHQKISYLANVGTISPMIGLLGTVFGMVMGFDTIASGDVRHYKLAAAIAQAMITTVAGLCIGIPAMATYFYLRGRLLRLVTHMEVVADELTQAVVEKGEEE